MTPAQRRFLLQLPGVLLLGVGLGFSAEHVHDMLVQSIALPPALAVVPTVGMVVLVIWGMAVRVTTRPDLGPVPMWAAILLWSALHLAHSLQYNPEVGPVGAVVLTAIVPQAAALLEIGVRVSREAPRPAQHHSE